MADNSIWQRNNAGTGGGNVIGNGNVTGAGNADTVNRGGLIVNVRTASGAIPVPGAIVTITPSSETEDGSDNPGVIYSLLSGEDGSTPRVTLDAPPPELTFQPNDGTQAELKPFTEYVVTVSADGFYVVEAPHIPIFGGINSILPVELIPLPEYQGDDYRPPVSYARGEGNYSELDGSVKRERGNNARDNTAPRGNINPRDNIILRDNISPRDNTAPNDGKPGGDDA